MENPDQISEQLQSEISTNVKVRNPKRILHFSDGTLEEFSDDDEQETQPDSPSHQQHVNTVDPKSLDWGPWITYKLWEAGSSTLWLCDYVGESLASTFGITTPKYYFEIEEFKRRQAEKEKLEASKVGWSENVNDDHLVTTQCADHNSKTTSV